ncbi:MAG TPA: type 4a pilus biogenesis protein PilO [Pseudomonadales bacterium]|nr:type 4a pilus biogenesis protein PilO [Pseudomonadales bacterium]
MSMQEKFEKLQGQFSNLDWENVGGWPLPVKVLAWIATAVAVVGASYQFELSQKHSELDMQAQKEISLRAEFEKKVQDAANIDAYRQQMSEMSNSFSTLLAQLPKDTEVPGLLDDITNKGQESGLNFQAIDLQPEKKAEFYIELPINIKVTGGYHDFGNFVSGVAGLPRIVTLHDFLIQNKADAPKVAAKAGSNPADNHAHSTEELSMTISAKTYRYKGADDGEDGSKKAKSSTKPSANDAAKKG